MNPGDLVWWHSTDTILIWAHVREHDGDMVRVEKTDGELVYVESAELNPAAQLPDGVYPDITDTTYHQMPHLSSSGAKLLLPPSVPAKYREHIDNPPEPKPHFDFGHVVHTLVLTKGPEFAVIEADDWRGKYAREQRDKAHAEGKTPILSADFDVAFAMEEAVRDHPIAGPLLAEGDPETSLFVTDPDTGVKLRARPDWMTHQDGRLWLLDVKTAADANPDSFGRTAERFAYYLQFAWYVTVARLLELDESPAFLFINIEKTPPYLVSVCELDMDAYQLGRKHMRQALDTYKQCAESGEWPGYPSEIHSVSLPPWVFRTDQPTVGDVLKVEAS